MNERTYTKRYVDACIVVAFCLGVECSAIAWLIWRAVA